MKKGFSVLLVSAALAFGGVGNLYAGTTEVVSVDSFGMMANGFSRNTAISSDGRYIAFSSVSGNLVDGDANNAYDIFVHDRETYATERVSVDSNGNEGNGDSLMPAISADGRYVAFVSRASNLVSDDANYMPDIFLHDRETGATRRVNTDYNGRNANGMSSYPSISDDGRLVSFVSSASDIVYGDTNWSYDVFVHDVNAGVTERVSVNSLGAQANGHSLDARLSGNGRFVAFLSKANNLAPNDTNGVYDVYVRDMLTGITERGSVASSGEQANAASYMPSISDDGNYVSFRSRADNLVPSDENGWEDIFVYDRGNGVTSLVSVNSLGEQANAWSGYGAISGDGSRVVFVSGATNLVMDDGNSSQDVFVHDTATGATMRVSLSSNGDEANGWSIDADISNDGRYISFVSSANNLIVEDINRVSDVFVHGADSIPNGDSGHSFPEELQIIEAAVDIDPNTLNRKSRGNQLSVTAYLQVPGHDMGSADVSSIMLITDNGGVSADPYHWSMTDRDDDGQSELMVKFDRQGVINIVKTGRNNVEITGIIGDYIFSGTDVIKVVH